MNRYTHAHRRVKKLAQRHKAAFATAGLVLLALLFGVAGTSWQAWQARKAQATSLENFRHARDTVNQLLSKVDENPQFQSPELQPLRKELLGVARDYYQHFVEGAENSRTVQDDLAKAYVRLGGIGWALGEHAIADPAHQQAVSVRRRLVAASPPQDANLQKDLAETLPLMTASSIIFALP